MKKGKAKEKAEKKETFAEHVSKVQRGSMEGMYGWWDLVDDANGVGMTLDGLPEKMPYGFMFAGEAEYADEKVKCTITMSPQLYLVSVKEDYEGNIFNGFSKLFRQEPDVVYKAMAGHLRTAEYWVDMTETDKEKNRKSIKDDPDYEMEETADSDRK